MDEYRKAEGNATSEELYRKEWATKTGRADSDIYIPWSLRGTEDQSASASPDAESIREDDNA